MFRSGSLLARIMFLHVAAILVTAICMPLALYLFLRADVDGLQKRALQGQAEAIVSRLMLLPDGKFALELPAALRDQYSDDYGRYAYAVLDDNKQVLFSSRKDAKAIFPIRESQPALEFFHDRDDGRTISGATVRSLVGQRLIWTQVAEDLAHRDVLVDDVVSNFFRDVGWITLPMLLVLLATDIVIFRRAVQPLLRASARAGQISPTRLELRLPADDIPREIVPLVLAVNKALDRLEHGFRRQKDFTADVAHELRTPLAILRTRIDTLPDQASAKALHRDIEAMTRVVSQLLDAADLETVLVDEKDKADLLAVCAQVAQSIAPLALAQDKSIALSGAEGPVWIWGNTELLALALRNLVENAIHHTPKATDIEIVVTPEGSVSVLDQGSGISAADRERIFERFWQRNPQRTGGAGLGLSIVKRIAEAHRASISVRNRPTGGADFTIRFVRAEPPPAPVNKPTASEGTAGVKLISERL